MNLVNLARYKSWADELLYESISSLPENELVQDRAMLFGNILSLLHHVYAMDIVWKSNMEGVKHKLQTRNPEVQSSLQELRKLQNVVNSWYENYFGSLGSDQSVEKVHFEYIGGGSGVMTRADILQHAVNHSSYHRGHIEGVLYQLDIEPPTTDISVFLKRENV